MGWYAFDEAQRWRVAPAFALPSAEGQLIALYDYRGRMNLVLYFPKVDVPSAWQPVLDAFAAHRADYHLEKAVVLALLPVSTAVLAAWPKRTVWPLLADEGASVRQAYAALLPDPSAEGDLLFILDRYGAPYAAGMALNLADLTGQREVLDWLAYIEMQCPE